MIYRNRLGYRLIQPSCWIWKFMTPYQLYWVLMFMTLFGCIGLFVHSFSGSLLGLYCSSLLAILGLHLIVRLPTTEDKDYPDLYGGPQ